MEKVAVGTPKRPAHRASAKAATHTWVQSHEPSESKVFLAPSFVIEKVKTFNLIQFDFMLTKSRKSLGNGKTLSPPIPGKLLGRLSLEGSESSRTLEADGSSYASYAAKLSLDFGGSFCRPYPSFKLWPGSLHRNTFARNLTNDIGEDFEGSLLNKSHCFVSCKDFQSLSLQTYFLENNKLCSSLFRSEKGASCPKDHKAQRIALRNELLDGLFLQSSASLVETVYVKPSKANTTSRQRCIEDRREATPQHIWAWSSAPNSGHVAPYTSTRICPRLKMPHASVSCCCCCCCWAAALVACTMPVSPLNQPYEVRAPDHPP